MSSKRTNRQWLDELTGPPQVQSCALQALCQYLQSISFYYLRTQRSDLDHLSLQEIKHLSEDMAQEAVLLVMKHLASFRGTSQFTTWAARIVLNRTIGELRRKRYQQLSLDDTLRNDEISPAMHLRERDPDVKPERAAERAVVTTQIVRALQKALTRRQYLVFLAVAVDEVPTEIVAEQMGTSRNAIHKVLYDARVKLRHNFANQGLTREYLTDLFTNS